MAELWRAYVDRLSNQVALAHLALRPERPALLVFAFHVLFAEAADISRHLVDPQQRTTVATLDELVTYFRRHGYQFVAPADIARGLDPAGRYAWLTFDDGYYNQRLALPVLRRHQVPATFFISSHHMQAGQAFWWDALYRHRRQHPLPLAAQQAEYALLKQLPYPAIDAYVQQHCGPTALRPVSDFDRPFTPAELHAFAQAPEVTLGNHTMHHAILPNYPPAEADQELVGCQHYLAQLSGAAPLAVAYPNGNLTADVAQAATRAGLQLGVTVEPGKNYLPLASPAAELLRLKRFMPWGTSSIERQCDLFRADFHVRERLRIWVRPTRRAGAAA